jgi:hypothetical protein
VVGTLTIIGTFLEKSYEAECILVLKRKLEEFSPSFPTVAQLTILLACFQCLVCAGMALTVLCLVHLTQFGSYCHFYQAHFTDESTECRKAK